jgi:hypothetical protein
MGAEEVGVQSGCFGLAVPSGFQPPQSPSPRPASWRPAATHLMLKVIFSSSFDALRSTTISDTVLTWRNAANSCGPTTEDDRGAAVEG